MKCSMTDYNSYYEKVGTEYNDIRLDTKNDRENMIKIIKKYANSKNLKVLDIGCGTGKYGELMKEAGYQVVGIDKSESQINQAKLLIESYRADATAIPFDEASFDICTMIIMIQQLTKEDRIKAFQEAYRVLKTKGILIIKTYSHEDLQYRFTAKYFPKTLKIDQARYPDIDELKKELSMFSEIEIEHSSLVIKKSKERYLNQYKKRGTSNLSFLTDYEIEEGIKKFEEDYKNEELIEKITKNIFVVARKKELL